MKKILSDKTLQLVAATSFIVPSLMLLFVNGWMPIILIMLLLVAAVIVFLVNIITNSLALHKDEELLAIEPKEEKEYQFIKGLY